MTFPEVFYSKNPQFLLFPISCCVIFRLLHLLLMSHLNVMILILSKLKLLQIWVPSVCLNVHILHLQFNVYLHKWYRSVMLPTKVSPNLFTQFIKRGFSNSNTYFREQLPHPTYFLFRNLVEMIMEGHENTKDAQKKLRQYKQSIGLHTYSFKDE